jgi:mRNA-degrading endonuclease toxin of MazEF toxin-antitoxin module
MTLSDALKKVGIPKVKVEAGGIYRLKDGLIRLPDGDKQQNRTKHDYRTVLVLSNRLLCNSYSCPCVVVAPMSHLTHFKSEADLIIAKTSSNKLAHDSRLMMSYIQPVLKTDLDKKIGALDDEEWQEVMAQIVFCFDR